MQKYYFYHSQAVSETLSDSINSQILK